MKSSFSTKRKIYLVGILMALLSIAVFVGFIILSDNNEGYSDGSWYATVSYSLLISILFWFVNIIYRTQSKQQRRSVWFIFAICIAWIIIRSVKWMYPGSGRGSRYLWYMYYAPFIFLPFAFFVLCNQIFYPNRKKMNITLFCVFAAIGLALVCLVMTNDLHRFVFSFTDEILFGEFNYQSGIGFYIVVSYAILLIVASFVEFLIGTIKRKSGLASAPIFFLLAGIIAYFVATMGFSHQLEKYAFLNDIVFINVFFVTLLLEVCLEAGFIQNSGRNDRYLRGCKFPLCIMDGDEVLYATHTFDLQCMIDNSNADKRFDKVDVHGYDVVVETDVKNLHELQAEVEKNNALLAKAAEVKAQEQLIKTRIELYDEIERSTYDQKKKIAKLVENLPDKVLKTNKAKTTRTLSEIRLCVSYLKQKSLVLISMKNQTKIARQTFFDCMRELCEDMRRAGVSNFEYTICDSENIDCKFALVSIELFYCLAGALAHSTASAMVALSPVDDSISARIEGKTGSMKIKQDLFKSLDYSVKNEHTNGSFDILVCREER